MTIVTVCLVIMLDFPPWWYLTYNCRKPNGCADNFSLDKISLGKVVMKSGKFCQVLNKAMITFPTWEILSKDILLIYQLGLKPPTHTIFILFIVIHFTGTS